MLFEREPTASNTHFINGKDQSIEEKKKMFKSFFVRERIKTKLDGVFCVSVCGRVEQRK